MWWKVESIFLKSNLREGISQQMRERVCRVMWALFKWAVSWRRAVGAKVFHFFLELDTEYEQKGYFVHNLVVLRLGVWKVLRFYLEHDTLQQTCLRRIRKSFGAKNLGKEISSYSWCRLQERLRLCGFCCGKPRVIRRIFLLAKQQVMADRMHNGPGWL